MHCEQAITLISAQIDREISAEEQLTLDEHLRQCPACRVTLEAFQHQDQELHRTFEPRREAVRARVAEVTASLAPARPTADSWSNRFAPQLYLMGSLAAAVAVILALAWRPRPSQPGPVAPPVDLRAEAAAPDWLVPRPRSTAPDAQPLQVGAEVKTRAGERKRVTLPDRSVLFVNQETTVRVENERSVSLSAGNVYLEVAPRSGWLGPMFHVKTPTREVLSLGTHFAVAADAVGTEVLVTQGIVGVSGLKQPILAGQLLERKSAAPAAAPRSSHLLEWTRELVTAAESPLVPGSQYSGGALIAVDQSGQQAKLSMRKYHVDVHIEDGFARTTIDQTYFNHHPWRLEGTFYFPLPPDASLSRLAMYVDGNLMEGGMAERDYARAVYEKIVRSQKDPALLEWVDGSTFKMRVFPLEGRQEKRIVLSYTQRLSTLYGKSTYRFPAGHNLQRVNEWSFEARAKNAAGWQAASPTHPEMTVRRENGDLVLSDRKQAVKVDQDVALELSDPAELAVSGITERIRLGKTEHENNTYLMLRYRPELPGRLEPQRRDFLFLFESSADRDPLLARTQIEVLRALLAQAGHDDTFNVVTAGTLSRFWSQVRRPATTENVAAALTWLERTHLIGALDLGEAMRVSVASLDKAEHPHLVHLGSGLTGMGTAQDELLKTVPATIRYVGIGVGKRWARAWMKQAAEKTGGLFAQINPDESVGWRAFELMATLNTPRLLDVRVEARVRHGEPPLVLVDNPTIAQGEELFAVTRFAAGPEVAGEGSGMPETLIVTGLLEGMPFRREVAVRDVKDGAGFLPRTWAKLEIDRLLATPQETRSRKQEIIELSKAMYVMTPFTSLLVLENEAMYREHNVDRGRKDHWALYPCPPKIPVVYEPDPTLGIDARNAPRDALPTCEQVMQTVLVRMPPPLLRRQNQSTRSDVAMTALQVYQGAIAWSETELEELTDREEFASRQGDRLEDRKESLSRGLIRSRMQNLSEKKARLGRTLDDLRVESFDLMLRDPEPAFFKARSQDAFMERQSLNGVIRRPRPELLFGDRDEDARRKSRRGTGIDFDSKRWNFVTNNPFPSDEAPLFLRAPIMNTLADYTHYSVRSRSTAPGFPLIPMPIPAPMEGKELKRLGTHLEAFSGSGSNWSEAALFQRLLYAGEERIFTDLVSYAPGLNSSLADVRATVEAEAAPDLRSSPGTIDPAARRLIERARSAGWQILTMAGEKGDAEVRVLFDGAGRYRWEQTLSSGLCEVVICDGRTLWHLYPEIGLAARRNVSRFHRAQLAGMFSWLPAPAEDLACGADLVLVEPRTVSIVPHPLRDAEGREEREVTSERYQLVFAESGRLAERRVVSSSGKVFVRQVFDGNGLFRVLDGEGKELFAQQNRLSPAQEPKLKPDLTNLVVVPMPVRTRDKAFAAMHLDGGRSLSDDANGCFRYLDAEQAVSLLASLSTHCSEDAPLLLNDCESLREGLRPGHFVLLASGGFNLLDQQAFRDWVARRPDDPLIRFLALVSSRDYRFWQSRWPINQAKGVGPENSFLGRLARFFDLTARWSQQPWRYAARPIRDVDAAGGLEFIRNQSRSPLALAMLCQLTQHIGHGSRWQLDLARLWGAISDNGKAYEPSYEQARALHRAGRKDEARRLFLALYERTLEQASLPVIDGDFFAALVEPGRADDPWMTLLLKTSNRLIERKNRPEVVVLAYQARALGDQAAFDNLLTVAFQGIKEERDRLETYLAAVEVLRHYSQEAQAEKLVLELLAHKEHAQVPYLWRLASQLADHLGQQNAGLDRLEHALDLEYRDLPEVINLETWRRDYRRLLDHYISLAGQPAGRDKASALVQRTIRAADRWRAHDPEEGRVACDLAGQVLKRLGQEALTWEYLTSPLALQPESASKPADLAAQLNRTGDHVLADRAYAAAFRSQPTQGQLLWDRAMNLIQGGSREQGRQLLRQLVASEEDWPQLKQQARWVLERE